MLVQLNLHRQQGYLGKVPKAMAPRVAKRPGADLETVPEAKKRCDASATGLAESVSFGGDVVVRA